MEIRPGYKQTEVGVIPKEWGVSSVLDLAERKKELFDDGDWIEAEYLAEKGIRLVQTGNIGEGVFADKESKKYISAESFKKLRCKDLRVGDLLICRLAEPAGRACILPDIGEERLITAVDVTIFRPPSSLADRRYLVNVFNTPRWFQLVKERCGGSTRTRIARGELGKITIPIPPLPEQRVIAEALSDVDALLGRLDRLAAKKRDLKLAVMQQLLTGQTRLPGFDGAWELGSIAELEKRKLVSLSRGNVISKKHIENTPGDFPIYSSSIHNDGLFGRYGRFMFNEELITWSVDGGGNFFYRAKHRFSVTNVCGFMRVDTSRVSYRFLAAHLQLLHSRKNFNYQSKAHPSVIRKEYNVHLPTLPEQTAIAEVLTEIDLELEALDRRREKTRSLKQAMMQELLTGKTRLV